MLCLANLIMNTTSKFKKRFSTTLSSCFVEIPSGVVIECVFIAWVSEHRRAVCGLKICKRRALGNLVAAPRLNDTNDNLRCARI